MHDAAGPFSVELVIDAAASLACPMGNKKAGQYGLRANAHWAKQYAFLYIFELFGHLRLCLESYRIYFGVLRTPTMPTNIRGDAIFCNNAPVVPIVSTLASSRKCHLAPSQSLYE